MCSSAGKVPKSHGIPHTNPAMTIKQATRISTKRPEPCVNKPYPRFRGPGQDGLGGVGRPVAASIIDAGARAGAKDAEGRNVRRVNAAGDMRALEEVTTICSRVS